MTPRQAFSLDVPNNAWEPTGTDDDPGARLYIGCDRLSIAGMSMHLEAFAIRRDDERGLVAADNTFDDEIEAIYTLRGDDPPATLTINSREYVLVAYPSG